MADHNRLQIDNFKGVLIFLVVLGHNSVFSTLYPVVFNVFYNFHVACFLLLPFVYSSRFFLHLSLKDRCARYLIPHYLFFGFASFCYLLLYIIPGEKSVIEWMQSLITAIVLSSEETCNAASGFRLFWFLPALVVLSTLRSFFLRMEGRVKTLFLLVMLIVHLFIGLVPLSVLPLIPWSLPLVSFVFPVGILISLLWQKQEYRRFLFLYSWPVFIICIGISIQWNSYIGLAGDPKVYSIADPLHLVFHDLYLVAAFFALSGIGLLLGNSLVASMGRNSLVIYLCHPFIWQGLVHSGFVGYLQGGNIHNNLALFVTLMLTLGLSWGCGIWFHRFPALYSFFFPRTWADSFLTRFAGQ